MHALCVPFEDIREATNAKLEAERQLKRLIDHPQDGGFNLPMGDARVVAAEKQVAKATDDLARLQERSEKRLAAWQSAGAALANVEDWVKNGRPGGTVFDAVEIEPPPLKKGEGILDRVQGLRRRVRELRADQHRLRSAPFPSSYAKKRTREMIEQLAQRGEPDCSMLIELDQDIAWPVTTIKSTVHAEQRALAFAEAPDTLALFAWLHRDALIKRLDGAIDAESDDKVALSHEQRQQAEAEVMSDLLAIEREESFFVFSAQSQGLPIEHRGDCSPLAILNLVLITVPRGETPGSSPSHAGFNLIGGGRR